MSSEKLEKYSMGSVEVFVKEYDKETMDLADNTKIKAFIDDLMKDENRFGYTKDGATLSYEPEKFEDSDDLGFVKIIMIVKETIKMTFATMVFNGKTISEICPTAHETITQDSKLRVVRIGGLSKQKNGSFAILAVHKDDVHGNTYNIIVGKNTGGFNMEYKQNGVNTFKVEFTAEPHDDDGTQYIYAEDIVNETVTPTPPPQEP